MNQGLIPQFEDYIAAYNATEPAAKVSLKPVPDGQADYLQQLVTEGLSGKLPDILFNYDSLNQTLDSNELLFDLKPWLEEKKSGLDGEEFVPAFLDQYKAQGPDGPITGIPVSADSTMLFYNKSIFEKYGISELPTEDWTYADMYRVAEQITKASAGATWGLRSPGAAGGLLFIDYPLLKANGSTIYNPDSGEFEFADANGLKAWKTMLAPYVEGWGSPYPTSNQDTNYFSGGQVAMSVDTRPTISKYRETITDDWDVVNLPTVDGEPTVGGGSYALSISEKSKNKESAWEFMAWFYSKDGGMKEAEPNGVIPATTSGLDHGTWLQDAAAVPTNLIPATQYSVKNAALQPAIPSEAQTEVVPALEKAAQEVLMGGKSIEVAYTAAEDALNALLK
ncbi:extracellular solute-binding protein [Arthrobacter sp. PAMC 25486]|uniref:extracellular solute-binding protein n=1 Tax=Arthrobacter sp. PAMC 25486 TaxID=1494608 RepID=UPI000B235EA4|nr:extracellular solute-binding protein [Arthrobacter sp. PAMC 25486]